MELASTSTWTIKPSEVEERSTTPTAVGTNGTQTTITKIPSWSQAEVASSQSAQRPIPPDEETKVFSWADVRDIVSMPNPPPLVPIHLHISSIFPKRIKKKILFCESISEPRSASMNTKTISPTTRNQPPRSHPAQTIRTRRLQSLVQRHIAAYGSITAYMCAERLRWTPLLDAKTSGPVFDHCDPTPFADPRDFRILRNDWPYGSFGPDITHLIVWSKSRIALDLENGS